MAHCLTKNNLPRKLHKESSEAMIGTNVKERMAELNLTQAELAMRSGVKQSTISSIINEKAEPKASTLEALAVALGTTSEALQSTAVIPSTFCCPRCGSSVVLAWHNHSTGVYRYRCGYCEVDSGEQKSKELAYHVFNSFKRTAESAEQAQAVHVLSMAELLDWACYDADSVRPVWFENRGLFIVPSLLQCGMVEREQNSVRVVWFNSYGQKSYMLDQYGKWWRCWNSRPTAEMSEAVAWED